MVEIHVKNSYSRIYEASQEELATIQETCAMTQKTFRKNKLTGKIEFKQISWSLLTKNGYVPTGFLKTVHFALKDKGFTVRYLDLRQKPQSKPISGTFKYEPRDYQIDAVNTAISKNRGIIKAATGSGKSLIGAMLINNYGVNTLFLVPDLNLLDQTYEVLKEIFGESEVGKIGGGEFKISTINVATAATIWSKRDQPEIVVLLNKTQLLILDEVHRTGKGNGVIWKDTYTKTGKKRINPTMGNTYYQITMQCKNAYYRFGLTATPREGEAGILLTCATGDIIVDIPYTKLKKEGYLSPVNVEMYDVELNLPKTTWRDAYTKWMKAPKINTLIQKIARNKSDQGKSVLIVIDEIENHGNILKDYLPEATILFGGDKDRVNKIKDLKEKNKLIYISTVIKQGVDIPNLDVVIRASAKKSKVNVIQVAGRTTRKANNKIVGTIVDFYVHGGGYLEKWSGERLSAYQEEGFNVKMLNEVI